VKPHRAGVPIDAAIALVLFGCIPAVVKSIAANPFTIGFFRLSVAFLGLLILLAMRRELKRPPATDLLRLSVIGLMFFGHWLTYFFSVKTSTASIAAIGLSTYGVDLLILGAIFGSDRIHASDIAAVLAAATGAILIVPEFRLENRVAFGMLLAAISAVMYATLPILHQRWSHLPTGTRALGQFGFALLAFTLLLPMSSWDLEARDWLGLIFLAVGPTLIGHSLWVRATTRLSPPATSIIYYGNLPVAVGLGVFALGEPLTARTMGGALLIVGGGIFGLAMRWRRRRLDHPDSPPIAQASG
jgi:drug/metabolite transporter (DMT)-like permease